MPMPFHDLLTLVKKGTQQVADEDRGKMVEHLVAAFNANNR